MEVSFMIVLSYSINWCIFSLYYDLLGID